MVRQISDLLPKSYFEKIFLSGFLIFVITAFFSEGFHHPDEHFQILEFCNYKLGNSPSADLPWEFKAQSRQTLPVFVAFVIIKSLYLLKVINPFTIAFILRLLTALSAWFIIRKLCIALLDNFKTENGKKLFAAMTMLLWFVPYLSVRFSSENLGGITFLFAIYLLLKRPSLSSYKKTISLAGAGLLLGFSFFFRFQMGFAIIGLGLWLIFINKLNWKNLLLLVFASSISVLLCICIDRWFYGNWVLTPVNYFTTQIIHDVVSYWGVTPWWNYFYLFILQGFPPISILLLAFFFIGIYKSPTNIFVWSILPFLIGHCAIGHKEMRFMFPMMFGLIYLAAIGIDHLHGLKKYEKVGRYLFFLSVMINVPLLILRMISPAQEAVNCYSFLFRYSSEENITLLCREKSIYHYADLPANFYRSSNVNCVVLNKDEEPLTYLNTYQPGKVYLLERKLPSNTEFTGYTNEIIYCLFPNWILRFNINDWESRARIWNIQKLRKNG